METQWTNIIFFQTSEPIVQKQNSCEEGFWLTYY